MAIFPKEREEYRAKMLSTSATSCFLYLRTNRVAHWPMRGVREGFIQTQGFYAKRELSSSSQFRQC